MSFFTPVPLIVGQRKKLWRIKYGLDMEFIRRRSMYNLDIDQTMGCLSDGILLDQMNHNPVQVHAFPQDSSEAFISANGDQDGNS